MATLVDAIIDKYGPGDEESFDFISIPKKRQDSTTSENGKCLLFSIQFHKYSKLLISLYTYCYIYIH